MSISLNLPTVVTTVLQGYALAPGCDHGVSHWARVLENGLALAERTGADLDVVRLFAVFHDSKRINEVTDHGHGRRGAAFAAELRGRAFDLDDGPFGLLIEACNGHTDKQTHHDATVQSCWDADRLDLGRIGIVPDPSRLCTDAARDPEVIAWAHGRASFRHVPGFVAGEWGIKLD